MACPVFFRSFWGAECATSPQSRGNARLHSIAGLLTWLVEIPSGLGSLKENKRLKNTKAFLYTYSPPFLPPPCCCFSPQSSCKRLPFKIKLGLESSSSRAVSSPPSSLFPPEVTQHKAASFSLLPGWLVRSHPWWTVHRRSTVVLVRGDGHLGILRGLKGYTFISPSPEQLDLPFLALWAAAQNKNRLKTIELPPPPKPRALLQNTQRCTVIVLNTGQAEHLMVHISVSTCRTWPE